MFSFWKKKKGDAANQSEEKPSREEIIAQAKANAAAAREEIGDETLEKIKEAMLKKENSPFMQAKRKIEAMDDDRVRDELKSWMKDK